MSAKHDKNKVLSSTEINNIFKWARKTAVRIRKEIGLANIVVTIFTLIQKKKKQELLNEQTKSIKPKTTILAEFQQTGGEQIDSEVVVQKV